MKRKSLLAPVLGLSAAAAIAVLIAAPSSAQVRYPQQSAPVAYSGLDCSRCSFGGTYCVVNPIRFEYTCAPQGTYACAGISATSYCRFGTTCWDGRCR